MKFTLFFCTVKINCFYFMNNNYCIAVAYLRLHNEVLFFFYEFLIFSFTLLAFHDACRAYPKRIV